MSTVSTQQHLRRQAVRTLSALDITNSPFTPSPLATGRFPPNSFRYYQCHETMSQWNCQRFVDPPFVSTPTTFKIHEAIPEPLDILLLAMTLKPFKPIHLSD